MSFDGFGDDPDFIRKLEEFVRQLKEMPGPLGDMIRQFLQQLESMDPEELNRIIQEKMQEGVPPDLGEFLKAGMNMFGRGGDIPFDLSAFMSGNIFEMASNPEFMERVQEFFKNMNVKVQVQPIVTEKEAYYEIIPEEGGGQLIVDLPGLTDIRFVDWELEDGVLSLFTINDTGDKYRAEVNFNRPVRLKEALATLKHGVLTLPFSYVSS